MWRTRAGLLCLLGVVAVLPACGDETTVFASGKVTITTITAVNPPNAVNMVGITPEPMTITGGDYSDIVGTKVEVRWYTKDENDPTIPGPTILHDGERDFASTSGIVTTPTTIVAQSPAISIKCTDMLAGGSVDGCVQVFLSSNALSDPLILEDLFQIPNLGMGVAALNIATAPACDPAPFTLTAAGLAPVGASVAIHWVDTTMGNSFDGLNETTTLATITSATTIEGLTPNTVLCGMNGASDIVVNLDRVEWVGESICITVMPPLMLTMEAPDLTTLTVDFLNPPPAAYAAAYLAGEVPSTYLENPDAATLNKFTSTEGFTITGTGFGPIGGNALVTFTDLAGGAVFDESGAAAVQVPALVVNATTIQGRLPGINNPANRLMANVATQVQVDFSTGCCVFQPAFAMFMAPPTTNVITNLTAGTAGVLNDGFMTQALASEFYACHSQQIQLAGNNYDPAPLRIRVYDQNLGPVAGRHGSNVPAPLAVDTDLRAPVIAAAMITGFTRLDPRIAAWDTNNDGLVPTTVRVTNVDGQCAESTVSYRTLGRQINRSVTAANINSNTDVTIDPTSGTGGMNGPPPVPNDFDASTNDAIFGRNLAVCMEDDNTNQTVTQSFSGTQLFVDWSRDGGVTWARTTIGAALDGFPAGATRSFPNVEYDRFGNLWLSYIIDDFTVGADSSAIFLAISFDQGASFVGVPSPIGGAAGVLAQTLVGAGLAGNLFRPSLATGLEPATAFEAAAVAYVDATTGFFPDRVMVASARTPAFGVAPLIFDVMSGTPVDMVPPAVGVVARLHARPAIGPGGELYVSWTEVDFGPFPPVTDIRANVDADGQFGFVAFFGADTLVVDNIEFPFLPPPSLPDLGRNIPVHDMDVIQAGNDAGRVIIAYESLTSSSLLLNPNFLHCVTTYSDDLASTWSAGEVVHQADTSDQFLPALAADDIGGAVYVTWYDTVNDPADATVQRFSARSANGSGWGTPLLISDGASAQAAFDDEFIEYGVWSGLDVWNGCVVAGWADTVDGGDDSDTVLRMYQQTGN